MTPQNEARVLRQLLRQVDRGMPRIYSSPWGDFLLWFAVALVFMVLFQLGNRAHPLVFAVVSALLGVVAGVYGFLRLVAKQWPAIRPHVNVESVASRLEQLGP
jgi:hypothetical protein